MNTDNSAELPDTDTGTVDQAGKKRLPVWPIITVLLALVCGGLAFWGTQRYLSTNATAMERELSARFRNIEVIVASKALQAGQKLVASDLAKRALPEAMTSVHSVSVEELEQVVGRQLLVALAMGEPLSRAALANEEVRSLAARLQPGARAVTVRVDDVTSQAGLVRPGDRVDLMLAEERSDQGVRCVEVTPLIDAVAVLATGQAQGEAQSGADELRRADTYEFSQYSTLTLDVTPAQAQQIAAALRIGELIPVLRGEGDLSASNLPALSAGLPECRQTDVSETSKKKIAGTAKVELWVGGQVPPARVVHEFPVVEHAVSDLPRVLP